MTSFAKWRPTAMIMPKDHIVSSDFSSGVPYTPSYANDPPDMQMIMSNSYARKWLQEKKGFKKKLIEYKNENEVFLMRRYVVRGHNKKMRDLELKKRVPTRIKIGKKVPFAVSLRPPDENAQQTAASKSREQAKVPKSKSTSIKETPSSHSRQEKKVEISSSSSCSVQGKLLDFDELNQKLDELAQTDAHLHAEQIGRKFKIHRVKCKGNHHHGCDCEVMDPDKCVM